MPLNNPIPTEMTVTAKVTLSLELFFAPPALAGTRAPHPPLRFGPRLTA